MAIKSFQSGQDVYEVGGKFPNYPDHVVGKIDFVPATSDQTNEEYSVDEEQEDPVEVGGKSTKVLLVKNREARSISTPEQFAALRMPKDLYAFYVDARKYVLVEDHDELGDSLNRRLAELLQKYEIQDLIIRRVFSEKRQVPHYDEGQPARAVIQLLLGELGEEYRSFKESRDRKPNGAAAES